MPTIPNPPTGISRTPDTIELSWTPISGLLYYIYRDNGFNTTPDIQVYGGSVGAGYCLVGNLNGNTTYRFRMRSYDSTGYSDYSNIVAFTTIGSGPSTPSGLYASVTSNSATLSWSTVSGATGYYVYNNGSLINTTSSNSCTIYNLSPSTRYTSYSVKAYNSYGTSGASYFDFTTSGSGGGSGSVPATPSQPSIYLNESSSGILLTWPDVPGATQYKIYNYGSSIGSYPAGIYTIYGIYSTVGTTYSLAIRASNAYGDSALSPALVVTAGVNPTVIITWNADGGSVSPVSSYLTANTIFNTLPTPNKPGYTFGGWFTGTNGSGTQITYSLTVPNVNTTYYAKWILSAPATPSQPTASMVTYNSMTISWSAVTGAAGYYIYQNGSTTPTYTASGISNTSWQVTGLAPNTNYVYQVAAYNASGTSPKSSTLGVKTEPQVNTLHIMSEPGLGMYANQTTKLMAFVDEPSAKITWSSSSPNIASIVADANDSRNATITTFNSAGSTNIKATANNGGISSNIVNLAVTNTSAPPPKTAIPKAMTVVIDNTKTVTLYTYNIGESNYAKLRDLAYIITNWGNNAAKHFNVGWSEPMKLSYVDNGNYQPIGGEMATLNLTVTKSTHTPPSGIYMNDGELNWEAYLVDDYNYVKLRDVMKTFDIYVGWDNSTGIITLDTSKGYVDITTMLDKFENAPYVPDPSQDSPEKRATMLAVGRAMAGWGYHPTFIIGMMGHITDEGNFGLFEAANTSNNYMNITVANYPNYVTDYSNQYIYNGKNVSTVKSMLDNLQPKGGSFGLGCCQWTYSRTLDLINVYLTKTSGTITSGQTKDAEIKHLYNELTGPVYSKIYTYWQNSWLDRNFDSAAVEYWEKTEKIINFNGNLNSADAAYWAGRCIVVGLGGNPSSLSTPTAYVSTGHAKTRGNNARLLYNYLIT